MDAESAVREIRAELARTGLDTIDEIDVGLLDLHLPRPIVLLSWRHGDADYYLAETLLLSL